jgi:hypothetical protein
MCVFPSTVGFAVSVEHHSENSVVRPKIADLDPASVQRPHRYRGARRPHRIENRVRPWGIALYGQTYSHSRPRLPLLWADTALQEFWCARRAPKMQVFSRPSDLPRKHEVLYRGQRCFSIPNYRGAYQLSGYSTRMRRKFPRRNTRLS